MSGRRAAATDLFGPGGRPRIAVIGAGYGGIGLAVKLKKAGVDSFTVFDSAPGPGGTWWHNTYPGAEVDTQSVVYSFPFMPRGWTRTHARQAELYSYLEDVIDRFGIRPHLRLSTTVESAVWDDAEHGYRVTVAGGEEQLFHVVVGATGFLNIPKYPRWPGMEAFVGPVIHSARWRHDQDLAGKRVAVVGTGSTATQVVPELAGRAAKVLVFQREPGWILPKGERDHTAAEQRRLTKPLVYRWERLKWFATTERQQWRAAPFRPGTRMNTQTRTLCQNFIDEVFADRPDLRAAVTPDHPVWGKRLIRNSTFYPALLRDDVELVPRSVREVTPTGVVDTDGVEHPVDALVLCTGFQTTDYLGTVEVRGCDGRTLQEHWAGEPQGFLGITVPGFPNFYMLYGPGTNGGEIVSMLLRQAEHVVGAVRRMTSRRVSAIDVRPTWAAMWHAWLLAVVEDTSFAQANNYYRGSTGAIVTQWPYGAGVYGMLTKLLGRASETSTVHKRKDQR